MNQITTFHPSPGDHPTGHVRHDRAALRFSPTSDISLLVKADRSDYLRALARMADQLADDLEAGQP